MRSPGEWFFTGPVKKKDEKRMATQPVPDFAEEFLNIPYMEDGHPLHTLNVYRQRTAARQNFPSSLTYTEAVGIMETKNSMRVIASI